MEELDEIEMELNDHSKELQPWMLTDEEILDVCRLEFKQKGWSPASVNRAIATAAVKKYQEWLAKQCGEKPCEGCKIAHGCNDTLGARFIDFPFHACGTYAQWLGQQQGYAKGLAEAESRVKAREGTMDFDTFVKALYSAGWRAPNDAQHKGAKSLWSSIQSEAESKVKAREREIVEWALRENRNVGLGLSEWLKGEV